MAVEAPLKTGMMFSLVSRQPLTPWGAAVFNARRPCAVMPPTWGRLAQTGRLELLPHQAQAALQAGQLHVVSCIRWPDRGGGPPGSHVELPVWVSLTSIHDWIDSYDSCHIPAHQCYAPEQPYSELYHVQRLRRLPVLQEQLHSRLQELLRPRRHRGYVGGQAQHPGRHLPGLPLNRHAGGVGTSDPSAPNIIPAFNTFHNHKLWQV